jgi:hypothetical protein
LRVNWCCYSFGFCYGIDGMTTEQAAQNEYIDAWASSLIKQKDTSGWFYEIMLIIMSLICFGFIGFLVVTL